MANRLAALACAAALALGVAGNAFAQEKWTTNGAVLTGWPDWCSRVGMQSAGLEVLFVLEATPCEKAVPMLSIIQAAPPSSEPIDMDQRFAQMLERIDSPAGKAYHLATATRQFGPCVQLSHDVNRNPLPGLRAYEARSSHACERYAVPADTRSLNIVVRSANGAVWTISLDHPGADLTTEQKTLLRRTAAELAAFN